MFNQKKGQVIHNGLDLSKLRNLASKKLDSDSIYQLIFAGRLAPQKGIEVVLDTLKLLLQKNIDVHLTLFGDGNPPYVKSLRSRVIENGISESVTFFGGCADWQAYANDADALIFPSHGEGTSNVVLEALTVGLPVVISDIAMSRELLSNHENALIVASNEASDWFAAIADFMNDGALRDKLSKNGQSLSEQFSVESMVAAYEALYQEMLVEAK